MKKKAIFAWSSGKDAAYGLQKTLEREDIEIVKLFTTITRDFDRVCIHGTKEELLDKQVERIGIPLDKLYIPKDCSAEEYEEIISEKLEEYSKKYDIIVYSDLFLEEVKQNREEQLENIDLDGFWPIWKEDTSEVASKIVENGFKALTVCVDDNKLDKNFVGEEYDKKFVSRIPEDVDPCGEKGEFHSFVYDAPYMDSSLEIEVVDTVTKPVATGKNHYSKLEVR